MKPLSELNKEEKIDLILKLQTGEVNVINGKIVELSSVIIVHGDFFGVPDKYSIGDQEFTPEEFDKVVGMYPEEPHSSFFQKRINPRKNSTSGAISCIEFTSKA
jgi:hypothetical protein